MTVFTDIAAWEKIADGVTDFVDITQLFFAASDLEVYLDGVLQIGGYTVTGAKTGAGKVTFDVAPAAGTEITILLVVPDTQDADYIAADDFPAATHEGALDRRTLVSQRIKRLIVRALRWPDTEQMAPDPTLPAKADRLGKTLGFNAVTGAPIALAPPANTTNVSSYGAGLVTAADAAAARNILDAAPHGYAAGPETPASMKVAVAAGSFFNLVTAARVENAAQLTAAFVAPGADPRHDIIHIDRLTGVIGVAAGVEAAVPVDPAIPAGTVPDSRVRLTTATATITAAEIDDLRELEQLGDFGAQDIQDQTFTAFDDTGVVNAYLITPVPAVAAYAKYQAWVVDIALANTGASTMNISGLGIRNIFDVRTGAALKGGEMRAGLNRFVDDGTQLVLMTPTNRGIILQTVTTQDQTARTTNSAIMVASGVQAVITLGNTSNKTRVRGHVLLGGSGVTIVTLDIRRNGTSLAGAAGTVAAVDINVVSDARMASFEVEDSPASTAALTYEIFWSVSAPAGFMGRRGSPATLLVANMLSVEEIAA